jgi:hypothetical protein
MAELLVGDDKGPSAYLTAAKSDWLARYPRKINVTFGCDTCYELTAKAKVHVTAMPDGSQVNHFIHCSEPCMTFNKGMNAMYWEHTRKRKSTDSVTY